MKHTMKQAGRLTLVLCAVALSTTACRGTVSRKTPVHLNTNMDQMAYLSAQEPSTFFEDGRGMRPQIEGTIAVGELRDDPHYFEGRVDGVEATELPARLTLDEALLARGEGRFGIYCAPCHGETGAGAGPVIARAESAGTVWIVPTLHDQQRQDLSVGRIYAIISEGYNTMPSYARQIHVEDRWAIAAWVKALQLSQDVELEQIPQDVRTQQEW